MKLQFSKSVGLPCYVLFAFVKPSSGAERVWEFFKDKHR